MTRTTNIEWTEHTWNPFVGCSIHTAGCKNCYAMKTAFRLQSFGTIPHYHDVVKKVNGKAVWTGNLNRASDRAMSKPLLIKKPAMIFVNSMSDFFHEKALDEWRIEAFNIMRKCPQHIFQVLTKRPENIQLFIDRTGTLIPDNCWLGVTVESGKYSHRINILKNVEAKIKFISFEPLIACIGDVSLDSINWAITGGESGNIRRTCNADWLRGIRDICIRDNVSFFHKQYGAAIDNPLIENCPKQQNIVSYIKEVDNIGKGGSLLDGIYHKAFPIKVSDARS